MIIKESAPTENQTTTYFEVWKQKTEKFRASTANQNFDVCTYRHSLFRFTAVYDSILMSCPLLLLSNLDAFLLGPDFNSVNQGMPVCNK